MGVQFLCSVGCMSSGSQHHPLACYVFCLKENLVWVFEILFLLANFHIFCSLPCSVTPASPLFFFLVHSFCLSIFLIESVGGGVLFPPPPFRHRGSSWFWPFCDFMQCFVGFPTCVPCRSGFVFLSAHIYDNVAWAWLHSGQDKGNTEQLGLVKVGSVTQQDAEISLKSFLPSEGTIISTNYQQNVRKSTVLMLPCCRRDYLVNIAC